MAQVVPHHDSDIKSLSGLKDKVVAVPDSLALVSLLGEDALPKEGISVGKSVYFQSVLSHRNVLFSVLKRKYVAGIVSSNVAKKFMDKAVASLRTVAFSNPVSSAMFMMKVSLPDAIKLKLAMQKFSENGAS